METSQINSLYDSAFQELGDINKEIEKITFQFNVRKPVLEKRRNTLQDFVQNMGEVIESERSIKETNPEFAIEHTRHDEAKRYYSHPKAHKVHSGKTENPLTDDIILKINYYLEDNGGMKTNEIYDYLVRTKTISVYPVDPSQAARIFGLHLKHYSQDLIEQDGHHGWRSKKSPTQQEIKTQRQLRLSRINNDTHVFHNTQLPRNEHGFVKAMNTVFNILGRKPQTTQELWKTLAPNNDLLRQSGVERYIEMQSKLAEYKDFFVRDENTMMYYPIQEEFSLETLTT